MELRPYQEEACAAILKEWQEGHRKTLLVLPTGCGKTIVFSKVAEERVRAGDRVLILAHRGELLEQAQKKLYVVSGLKASVEKAEETSIGGLFSPYRITVGSVQTMMREKRLNQFDPNYFKTIIVDETHHILANSYQTILNHFHDANVLGVTATPDRSDMKNLGSFFDSLAYEYTLPQAIKAGYLSKIKVQTIPLNIDISHVGMSSGDYSTGELGDALEPYLDAIAKEMAVICKDRKTVVFLPLVETSKKFVRFLRKWGLSADEVNGSSTDRAKKLKDFEEGKFSVLCNAMLLTEGWDCPSVDCVVVLRATKSRSLYCQMVGRGTRISPETGKENLLLLDFLWQTERHELCRPAYLIAKSAEVRKKMTQIIEEKGAPEDLEEVEEQAESEVVAEREKALAEELKAMRKRKRQLIDPLQYELSISSTDLANYVPTFAWEMAPMSAKQKKALEKAGIYTDEIECAGKASLILDRLNKRRNEGLATPKQIRFLEQRNFQQVGAWTFDAASRMISRIAENHWMIPYDIDPSTYVPAV